jgi:hypothetical protein
MRCDCRGHQHQQIYTTCTTTLFKLSYLPHRQAGIAASSLCHPRLGRTIQEDLPNAGKVGAVVRRLDAPIGWDGLSAPGD